TTQTVLAHTEKYHDAYTTIDKIVDSFWERVPYICIAIIVFIILWIEFGISVFDSFLLSCKNRLRKIFITNIAILMVMFP
ncbi:hypothetical protein ABTP50_21385, partial [Acinetobacter baumannii]